MNKSQGKETILISLLSILMIIGLAIYKLLGMNGSMRIAGGAISLIYVLWIISEMKIISIRDSKKENSSLDKHTYEYYGASRIVLVISGFLMKTIWSNVGVWTFIGIFLFVFGLIFRIHSINILGEFYSHRVRICKEHKIIDYGPYKYIRHPAYCGMIIAHLGFTIFFFNIVTALIYAFVFIPAVVLRIKVEEKALFKLEGYEEYAKTRKRVIPFVW